MHHVKPSPAAAADETPLAILDQLGVAILLVDRHGHVQYSNRAASTALLEHGAIHVGRGLLETRFPLDTRRLRAAIAETCRTGKVKSMIVNDGNSRHPPTAIILPFHQVDNREHGHALVLVLMYEGISVILIQALRELFRLSQAEAAIAVALGCGEEPAQLALERKVTLSTLRTQIASILSKTHAHRIPELVSLVARLDAVL